MFFEGKEGQYGKDSVPERWRWVKTYDMGASILMHPQTAE